VQTDIPQDWCPRDFYFRDPRRRPASVTAEPSPTIATSPALPTGPEDLRPLLLTAKVAAALLAISQRKLWQLTKDKELRAIHVGRAVRYRLVDLEAWCKAHS
jgi:excisionase family DNA binding protein